MSSVVEGLNQIIGRGAPSLKSLGLARMAASRVIERFVASSAEAEPESESRRWHKVACDAGTKPE